jgi:hypothetical protein
MGLRVLSYRLIQELNAPAGLFALLPKHHVMDRGAGQPIRTGDDHPVQRGLFAPIPQAIHAWPIEGGATLAIITKNSLHSQRLTRAVQVGGEARDLRLDRVCQRLPLGRHAGIDG